VAPERVSTPEKKSIAGAKRLPAGPVDRLPRMLGSRTLVGIVAGGADKVVDRPRRSEQGRAGTRVSDYDQQANEAESSPVSEMKGHRYASPAITLAITHFSRQRCTPAPTALTGQDYTNPLVTLRGKTTSPPQTADTESQGRFATGLRAIVSF